MFSWKFASYFLSTSGGLLLKILFQGKCPKHMQNNSFIWTATAKDKLRNVLAKYSSKIFYTRKFPINVSQFPSFTTFGIPMFYSKKERKERKVTLENSIFLHQNARSLCKFFHFIYFQLAPFCIPFFS